MARLWKRKGNCVMWTERSRLLLIETIIQVEKEMMHKPIRVPIGKWKRITHLLAQKSKGRSEAAPILEKCKNGFYSIHLQYRRYLVSGTPCPMLTERVLEIMKKRDDLMIVAPISVAQYKSASTGQAARKFSFDHANKPPDRKHGSLHFHKNNRKVEMQGDLHKSRERHKAASASFESVSMSSRDGPGGHDKPASSTGGSRQPRLIREFEDPADLALEPGLRRSARFEASTQAQASTRPSSRESGPFLKRCPRFEWTERERILLIEIVIQVEEDRKLGKPVHPSNGIQIGKWERINCLLPRNLQAQSEKCKRYRCASMFHRILTDYKGHLQGKSPKSYHTLTKPILETMRKREDLLNGVTISVRESKSTSRQQTATSFSLDHANNSERNQEGPHFDKSAREIVGRQGDLIERRGRHDASASVPKRKHFLGRATEDPNYHDKPASSTGGFKPRLVRESKDSDLDLPERSGRPGAQTRAQTSRRPSSQKSGPSRSGKSHNDPEDLEESSDAQTQAQTSSEPPTGDASSTRKSTTSMPHTAFEERRQEVNSNELLRRLDMEFSELTSWVENQLIPLGKKDCNQMAISAIRSSKKRKLSDAPSTQPLDSIFDECMSRKADLGIQMKFQNLRVEVAQLLKRTSVDVAQVFTQT